MNLKTGTSLVTIVSAVASTIVILGTIVYHIGGLAKDVERLSVLDSRFSVLSEKIDRKIDIIAGESGKILREHAERIARTEERVAETPQTIQRAK